MKYLKFEAPKGSEDLYSAIKHYQSTKNITSTAPDAFLDDNEHAAIHRDEKFNVSLYKAILFCKIAAAINATPARIFPTPPPAPATTGTILMVSNDALG